MEAIIHRVKYKSRKDIFKLYPLGDIHAGTIYCAESKIKAQVKAIEADPLALWIGMGDYADLVTPKDKRWESHTISKWVDESNTGPSQKKWVKNLFEPIKDKCIGLLGGNHESAIRKWYHYNFMKELTDDTYGLGVPYLGYSCFVRFIFHRRPTETVQDQHTIIGHFKHGSGSPQTEGGKMMNLMKALGSFEGDIYAEAHLHDIKIAEKPILRITQTNPPIIKDRTRCAAITGCWFQTYMQGVESSYGEEKGYSPTPLGCPVFTIDPTRELVNVFSNTNMVMQRLGLV